MVHIRSCLCRSTIPGCALLVVLMVLVIYAHLLVVTNATSAENSNNTATAKSDPSSNHNDNHSSMNNSVWVIHNDTTTMTTTATAHIIGGQLVPYGKYPFFAAIMTNHSSSASTSFVCGGVLIWPDIVLSAAHCYAAIAPSTSSLVAIGGTTINNGSSTNAMDIIPIRQIIVHPSYDITGRNPGRNDIMILVLTTPVKKAIPIRFNTNSLIPKTNQTATVLGHGQVTDINSTAAVAAMPSNELKEATVRVVDTRDCQAAYAGTISVNETWCAVRVSGVHCVGDSGGPIFVSNNITSPEDPYLLVGLASFSASTSCQVNPNGYTRISTYATWIQDTICLYSTTTTTTPMMTPPNTILCHRNSTTVPPTTKSPVHRPTLSPVQQSPFTTIPPPLPTTQISPPTTRPPVAQSTNAPMPTTNTTTTTIIINPNLYCHTTVVSCNAGQENWMHHRRRGLFYVLWALWGSGGSNQCTERCVAETSIAWHRLLGWKCGGCP